MQSKERDEGSEECHHEEREESGLRDVPCVWHDDSEAAGSGSGYSHLPEMPEVDRLILRSISFVV